MKVLILCLDFLEFSDHKVRFIQTPATFTAKALRMLKPLPCALEKRSFTQM
jgi:hypothetical protein